MRKNVFNVLLIVFGAAFSSLAFADASLQPGLWEMNMHGISKSSFSSATIHIHGKHKVCIHPSKKLNNYFIPDGGFFHCTGIHHLKNKHDRFYMDINCHLSNGTINEKGWIGIHGKNVISRTVIITHVVNNHHKIKIVTKDSVSGKRLSSNCSDVH